MQTKKKPLKNPKLLLLLFLLHSFMLPTLEGYPRTSTPPSSSTRNTRSSRRRTRAGRPAGRPSRGPTPRPGRRSAACPSPPASRRRGRWCPRRGAGRRWRFRAAGSRRRRRRRRGWWRRRWRPRGPSRRRWPKQKRERERERGKKRKREKASVEHLFSPIEPKTISSRSLLKKARRTESWKRS